MLFSGLQKSGGWIKQLLSSDDAGLSWPAAEFIKCNNKEQWQLFDIVIDVYC